MGGVITPGSSFNCRIGTIYTVPCNQMQCGPVSFNLHGLSGGIAGGHIDIGPDARTGTISRNRTSGITRRILYDLFEAQLPAFAYHEGCPAVFERSRRHKKIHFTEKADPAVFHRKQGGVSLAIGYDLAGIFQGKNLGVAPECFLAVQPRSVEHRHVFKIEITAAITTPYGSIGSIPGPA